MRTSTERQTRQAMGTSIKREALMNGVRKVRGGGRWGVAGTHQVQARVGKVTGKAVGRVTGERVGKTTKAVERMTGKAV